MSQLLPKVQDWFEERESLRVDYLARTGWADSSSAPVGEDCAFRRYFRLQKDSGETVILMEAVPDGSSFATPGHNMGDFIRISDYLRSLGLKAPQVFDVDRTNGYLLIEDFGDCSFKKALHDRVSRDDLYGLATDVLQFLSRQTKDGDIILPRYYDSHVHTGRRRLVDWYRPALLLNRNDDGLADDYLAVWDKIEQSLPPVPQGFLHIDYHFENLMWLPAGEGLARCGILDFQGAMVGPVPYDLANLLEDARVDVPFDLRDRMLARFCQGMDKDEEYCFRSWYRILATQFHCRVMGQFIRLALRDGKTRYLQFLPRVGEYIAHGLQDPVLSPMRDWLTAQKIVFDRDRVCALDLDAAKTFIRDDAF